MTAPAAVACPGEHTAFKHDVVAPPGENLPAAHCVHAPGRVAPVAALAVPGAHVMGAQLTFPPADHCPATQVTQPSVRLTAPVFVAPEPAAQATREQVSAVPPADHEPMGHAVHPSVALAAPPARATPTVPAGQAKGTHVEAAEYVPKAHSAQNAVLIVAPDVSEPEPSAQAPGTHCDDALVSVKRPAGHGVHSTPPPGENEPAGHAEQVPFSLAPSAVGLAPKPGGHVVGRHEVALPPME